jgi:hypothetical protein
MTDKKLLLILCSSGETGEIRKLLQAHEVEGFTEISGVLGAGVTGLHLGTRAFPGSASMIFSATSAEKCDELIPELRGLSSSCCPGEGLKVYVLDVAEAI